MSTLVADVDQSTFDQTVIEGSRSRPVVVDFWAEWCGPCRQLSPALEEAASRFAGDVDVVKVDVDANPQLAQQFGVQGISAVKAFADGKVVKEFTGLQPPQVIEQFFADLAPSRADRLVTQAQAEPDQAEALYRQVLEAEVDHPGAALGLADIMAQGGDIEGALEVLGLARPTPEVQQATAVLSLQDGAGNLTELTRAVEGGDDQARVALGKAQASQGQHEQAIASLLVAVAVPDTRDDAREALLEVFTVQGGDHQLVKAARPKLAAALF